MKRILITCLLTLAGVLAYAQDLEVHVVFDGDVVSLDDMVVTKISGSSLDRYKLTEFHSVKFLASESQIDRIGELILSDAPRAVEKETAYVGSQLVYALLVYQDPGDDERDYICYQVTPSGARKMVTLVYMCGTAGLDELKDIFAPRNND